MFCVVQKHYMNGVLLAPHGLILGEDGATASKKLSKSLLPQRPKNIENQKSPKSLRSRCPNWVPVARLGLILGEDGATASRKLLR